MATMMIAVIRLLLIFLSAYDINQPNSLSVAPRADSRTTQLMPNGSIPMYHNIIDKGGSLSRRRGRRNPPQSARRLSQKRLKFAVHAAKHMGNRTLICP